jgi:thiol:disulfide interchange protein
MMRLFNYLLLGVFTFLTLACKTQQQTVELLNVEQVSDEYSVSFIENGSISLLMEKAKSENKIIFLDFYADWCGPCKQMDREVFQDNQIGEFFNENFINFKVNGDRGPGRELANLYDVKGYPTVVFIDPKGVVLNRQIGLIFQEQLMSLAEQSIKLYRISS